LPEVPPDAGRAVGHLRRQPADGTRSYVALHQVAAAPTGAVWTPAEQARDLPAVAPWWPLVERLLQRRPG
ncbi:hypothetical protein, partial [Angustibacter peucedani]